MISTNSARNWVAIPPTPRHPPRPIRRGRPSRLPRRPAAQTGRAAGASRTSSPSPPARAGQDGRALCAHDLHPLPSSLARPGRAWRPRADLASGRRTPRTGGRDHRTSRTRAHLPVLWLSQSWRDPPGGPRPCPRAAPGRGDVLLQRPSSPRPTRRGRDRRDDLRGADLAGLRSPRSKPRPVLPWPIPITKLQTAVRDGPGQEHRRDRLEREGTEALAVGGGDRDGRLLRDSPAAQLRGPTDPLGRGDHRRRL